MIDISIQLLMNMPNDVKPDISRIKRSRSKFPEDKELKRLQKTTGWKNSDIIFSYITSLAYDRIFHKKGPIGKKGIDVVTRDEWNTPEEFLMKMGWSSDDEDVMEKNIFILSYIFNSLLHDGVFDRKQDSPQYKFIEELDYPKAVEIEQVKSTNKFLIMLAEDFINGIPETLATGSPKYKREKSATLPMWEALLTDPLTDALRDEMLLKLENNLPKVEQGDTIRIAELGSGSGTATVKILKLLTKRYQDIIIKMVLQDDVPNLIKRARERLQLFRTEYNSEYRKNNLEFNFNFHLWDPSEPFDDKIKEIPLDLILSFQHLQFVPKQRWGSYFQSLMDILGNDGDIIMVQPTSYNETFPHPLGLMLLSTDKFRGYPVADNLKSIISQYFGSYSSWANNSIWKLSNPKK